MISRAPVKSDTAAMNRRIPATGVRQVVPLPFMPRILTAAEATSYNAIAIPNSPVRTVVAMIAERSTDEIACYYSGPQSINGPPLPQTASDVQSDAERHSYNS